MSQFQIRKDDFSVHRTVDTGAPPGAGELAAGEVLVKIERFAFTANNITYAVTGDMLGYWQFFPAVGNDPEGWGVIPVWGFAEVVQSTVDEIPVGDRLFGYLPPANHLIMKPVHVSEGRFFEGAAHRAKLPPTYNSYSRIGSGPGHDPAMENERMLLWPLFITGFCLWDALQQNNWYGAQRVVIVSASSKTSIGLAYALADDKSAPPTIGITSARNLDQVNSIGLYDNCVSYDTIEDIDASIPTVIVDMAGNTGVQGRLHRHLGDNMKHCLNVGLTHREATAANDGIIAERSEMFFAPNHIQQRVKDWGPDGFERKTSEFFRDAALNSRAWLRLRVEDGLTGLASVYPDVCEGRIPPDEGIIIELWHQ